MVKKWSELSESSQQTYINMSMRLHKAKLKQSDVYHLTNPELAKKLNIKYNIYTKKGKIAFDSTIRVIKNLRVYKQPYRSEQISKKVFQNLKKQQLKKQFRKKLSKKKIEKLKRDAYRVSGVNIYNKMVKDLMKSKKYKRKRKKAEKRVSILLKIWKIKKQLKKLSKKEKNFLKQYG